MKIKEFLFKNKLLIISIFIAIFLRFYKLDIIPPHLTPDEASLGYNAYSILKTGKDEYGKLLPLIFKSFGDYKPGFYIYLTVPFVSLIGLDELSVRLPSALAGVISVFLIYKITSFLLKGRKGLFIGQISAFLLAINPWHIYFSRGAWEANLSLTLTLFGIYFFLKSIDKTFNLLFSSVFFSLTLLTYQGAKLSTLLILLVLIIVYWKNIRIWLNLKKKYIASSLIIGVIIVLPVVISLFSGKAGRLGIFSLFSYSRPKENLQSFLNQGNEKIGDLSYYLFHSEKLNFTRSLMGRWFNHFSGKFLFFEGDYQNPRHSAPNQGMLLIFDAVLLVIGFITLIKIKKKISLFIILWLLLSPLPAALSRDQVHAVRALNMVIPLIMISSFGIYKIFIFSKSKKYRLIYYFIFVFLYLVNYIYFLDAYFIHLNRHNSKYWDYGYKQIVEAITPIQNNYKNIRIQQSFAQPYIYFLFYQKYDPVKYQKNVNWVESEYKGDVGYIEKLDNICFCAVDWSVNRGDHGSLIVADPIRIPDSDSEDPKQFKQIKEIDYLNGEKAFKIIEIK